MPRMVLVLDISVSAEFWRRVYPTNRAPGAANKSIPTDCANHVKDVYRLAPSWIDDQLLKPCGGKIHAYVFDLGQRRASSRHITHVWSAPVPEGSFYELNEGVLIASPEFVFLGAASILSEHALIALGYELCGLYSLDHAADRGMRKRSVPLTSVEKMLRFLGNACKCPGREKAERALRHVIERSASPMETFDAMALFGTYRLGGYCLETPVMNIDVPLNDKAARIAKRTKCRPDICLLRIMLDIEHDGTFDHSDGEAKSSDRARTNALKEMGFEVIELTEDQVKDLYAFEYIALRIAKMLGKRIDKSKLGATPARLALRRKVFAWNRSGGKIR